MPHAPLRAIAIAAALLSVVAAFVPRPGSADGPYSVYIPAAAVPPNPASNVAGVWYNNVSEGLILARAAESGAQWVRVFLLWEDVEPVLTTPPTYDWSQSDLAIGLLAANGLEPIVNVSSPPTWAAFPICAEFKPGMVSRFADFLNAAAARYAAAPYRVRYWQLYNEPDFVMQDPADKYGGDPNRGCWGAKSEKYGEMLRVVYPAIKSANPDAQVVIGALTADNCGFQINCDFLRDVIDPSKGNAGNAFDVVSFNYYYWFRRDKQPGWERFGTSLLGKAEGHRRILSDFGLQKPIMVAEVGMRVDGTYGTSDDDRARFVPAALTMALADHGKFPSAGIQQAIWFSMSDVYETGFGATGYWGLTSLDGAPKSSFVAFRTWTQEMTGAKFVQNDSEPTYGSSPNAVKCLDEWGPLYCGALQKFVFSADGGSTEKWVVWIDPGPLDKAFQWKGSPATRTVEVQASRVIRVLDRYGGQVSYPVIGAMARITVSDSPVYVIFRP